jgi:hypothetical protein
LAGRRNHSPGDAGQTAGLIGRRELLAGGAALGLARPAVAAVSTLPDVEAPFKMDGGRPWTGVWIDKQGPFRFGISTGSNTFAVWDDLATRLKLNPTTSKVQLSKKTSSAVSTVYEAKELLIGGGFALTRVPLMGFRAPDQPSDMGQLPLVADRVTTFDFKAGIMRSLREAPADRTGYVRTPMIYEANVGTWTPRVQAKIGGKPVRLRISTGSFGVVSLSPQAVNRLGLWNDETPYSQRTVDDGARDAMRRVTRRGDLELGDFTVSRPLLTLNNARGSAWVDVFDDDGVIGIDLLRRLDLIIDQPKRNLWTRPNADFETPWSYDRAGFDVEQQDGVWKVSVVDGGSPAEQAGLKVGDQVVTQIDSVRRARYAPAGAQVAFNVLRGGERVRIPMTLADWL